MLVGEDILPRAHLDISVSSEGLKHHFREFHWVVR